MVNSVDPKRDIEVIQTELELYDLETREKVEAKRKKMAWSRHIEKQSNT